MKCALVQFDIFWEDVSANIGRVQGLLSGYRAGELDLVVLPELWSCGFTMSHEAHHSHDAGMAFMTQLAQRLDCHVVGGLPAKVDGGQENRCYWVHDGEVRYYTKNKTFNYAGEHLKYRAGSDLVRWSIGGFQASAFICYDLRFPELARNRMPESNLLIYVANWPTTRVAHWRALLVARAIENQSIVIGVNRVGLDPTGLTYPGSSMVILPNGDVQLEAGRHDGVFLTEINPSQVVAYRQEFPFLEDMTP